MSLSRRTLVTGTMATAAAGALTAPALLEWAKAWAQTAPWKPERGAQLSMLRWKSFVQSEDNAFIAVIDAFTKATRVKVTVSRESIDDVQPKASVAANTGSGPDFFWGNYSLPHLFPNKCLDVTDVAEYLGKKYGGWVPSAITYGKGTGNKWIDIPVFYNGVSINYRISAMKKAGFSNFPATTDELLEYAKATKANKSTARCYDIWQSNCDLAAHSSRSAQGPCDHGEKPPGDVPRQPFLPNPHDLIGVPASPINPSV